MAVWPLFSSFYYHIITIVILLRPWIFLLIRRVHHRTPAEWREAWAPLQEREISFPISHVDSWSNAKGDPEGKMRKALRDRDGSCEGEEVRRTKKQKQMKERSRAPNRSSEVISIQAVATMRK